MRATADRLRNLHLVVAVRIRIIRPEITAFLIPEANDVAGTMVVGINKNVCMFHDVNWPGTPMYGRSNSRASAIVIES